MTRWLVIYKDRGRTVAKILLDQDGGQLPFGVEQHAEKISPGGDFDVVALVELPTDADLQVVIDDEMVEDLETVNI